jgi:hypothetical protein
MIKNSQLLSEFNARQIKEEKLTYSEALSIFEEMWKEAVSLGVLPLDDPLEGIEVDIRVARILNHV